MLTASSFGYKWGKIMISGDFVLERLTEDKIQVAKELCDRHVGDGLYSVQDLRNSMGDESHYFYLVKDGPSYAGYFYCRRIIADSLSCLPGLSYQQISPLCGPEEEIGVFISIGIESDYKGSGLSDSLISHFREYFRKEFGISLILVSAWNKAGYVPAEKLLLRCGFKYLCDLLAPWENNTELKCPYCKKERCICNAVVYYSEVCHDEE